MRKKLLFTLVLVGLVLVVAVPAIAANTGITGKAVDGYGNGWQHGGTVYIIENCTYIKEDGETTILSGTEYGSTPLTEGSGSDAGDFTFIFPSPPAAQPVDPVCIYIAFNQAPGSPYPPPQPAQRAPFYTQNSWVSGVLSVSNIGTGTGPTAVTLASAAAESPNLWGLVALAIVALVGTGVAVLLVRRRRSA